MPVATPHAQSGPAALVGRQALATMSRTTGATAQPALPTQMTTLSFASSGGGGEGRSACSPVGLVASTL